MSDPRKSLGTFEVVAGDPLSITVNVKDTTGAAVNLTVFGTTWAADLRQAEDDVDPAASFTVDDSAADSGVLVLSLTGPDTTGLLAAGSEVTLLQSDLVCEGGTVSPQTPFHLTVTAHAPWTH